MSEQLPDRPRSERPVLAGLAALVGVAAVVGLVIGLVVLAGTRVLGLGDGADGATASEQRSMYLPRPVPTPTPTAAQITLAPGPSPSGKPGHGHHKPKDEPSASESAREQITLSASTTSAAPMEQFDLSGVYAEGEGAILTVQRFQSGAWEDFPATGSVSGGAFQIPVQTSQAGVNRFRVVDTDADLQSNQVRVTIR